MEVISLKGCKVPAASGQQPVSAHDVNRKQQTNQILEESTANSAADFSNQSKLTSL